MAQLSYSEPARKMPLHQRIMANLRVQASWFDKTTGKSVLVEGTTENVGEHSALVTLETLPPVGSAVCLRIMEEEKTLIEVPAEVIRVQRDPTKPLAALSVVENLKKWKDVALSAAEAWTAKQWLEYQEEYVG